MKTILTVFLSIWGLSTYGQVQKYDFPDSLMLYGTAESNNYGLTASNPIKVGGGILPKHVHRYLNNLVDSNGARVSYERIGSCCAVEINRQQPLTSFRVSSKGDSIGQIVYFDQYKWDFPKILEGFQWQERRKGYYGTFKNDTVFHGTGVYFFQDGGYYKGQWKEGIMSGLGKLYLPEQETYLGQFEDGKYTGEGTAAYADGGKYIGSWQDGKKQGKGKLYYPEGIKITYIEGMFENDKPVGKFTIYNADGTIETGAF